VKLNGIGGREQRRISAAISATSIPNVWEENLSSKNKAINNLN
jgi:hypothetical protein